MQDTVLSKRFIAAFLRLTRTWNLMIIAVTQYFTAWFLVHPSTIDDVKLFLLCVSTIAIAAGGYIINDYFDIKIDLINKPDRVVVGKSITRRFAIFFHITLSLFGIMIGFYLSLIIGAIHFFSVVLLWFYSSNFKRQPLVGNLTVAFLTGMAVYVIDVLYPPYHPLITIYAIFAFFMTLVREIIKDMEDLRGDDTFGCRTIPIVWGLRKTKMLIYAILVIFTSAVILFNTFYTQLAAVYFIMFLFVPLITLAVALNRADMKRDFKWLSAFCKMIMLIGILSMSLVQ